MPANTNDSITGASDSFQYRVNDKIASGNIATVTLNVTPVNDPPVFTLGAPVPGLARALLVRMVRYPAYLGGFFGLLAVVEQTGFLVLGLALAGLFDVALEDGDGSSARLGLPLYVAAGLFVVFAVCLWLARPVPREGEEEVVDDEEEEEEEGGVEVPRTPRSSTRFQGHEGRDM